MDEWQHNCARDGRVLLIPANECCDCCGMEPPGDHYFDRLERWLGFGAANAPADGVTPSDEARELTVHYARLGTHVENFALSLGWKREDGEGAFEFVQRKSYRQGWEDGKQEGSGDIHRDGVSASDHQTFSQKPPMEDGNA